MRATAWQSATVATPPITDRIKLSPRIRRMSSPTKKYPKSNPVENRLAATSEAPAAKRETRPRPKIPNETASDTKESEMKLRRSVGVSTKKIGPQQNTMM